MAERFTDQLRARLAPPCPTCGHVRIPPSSADLADELGVSRSTLWRFLNGAAPSAKLVDAIVAFLDRQPG